MTKGAGCWMLDGRRSSENAREIVPHERRPTVLGTFGFQALRYGNSAVRLWSLVSVVVVV